MKKFAFLVHIRSSYQTDLSAINPAFGWIPESVYEYALANRPFAPFVWSEVSLTPGAKDPQGYVIMLPYSGKQMLTQQRAMMPRIEQGMALAKSLGAGVVGLGALTSPVTLGGKLLTHHTGISVTNGNAFTAVITWRKISELIMESGKRRPLIALVGATGSVGSLVSKLLAHHNPQADYLLVARNERKLKSLAIDMNAMNAKVSVRHSQQMEDVKEADIVVLLTSAAEALLDTQHLKYGAVIVDDTIPRNTQPSLAFRRPDVKIIDGGLVSMPYIQLSRDIGMPDFTSYACLAETMLLSLADHEGHFSIGNPTLDQAEYISNLSRRFSLLGFRPADDHSFGKLIETESVPEYSISPLSLNPSFKPSLI